MCRLLRDGQLDQSLQAKHARVQIHTLDEMLTDEIAQSLRGASAETAEASAAEQA